jgi:hypothetical protein
VTSLPEISLPIQTGFVLALFFGYSGKAQYVSVYKCVDFEAGTSKNK